MANHKAANGERHDRRHLLYIALGALGVVYGDIGTSPLYAFREAFHEGHDIEADIDNVLRGSLAHFLGTDSDHFDQVSRFCVARR